MGQSTNHAVEALFTALKKEGLAASLIHGTNGETQYLSVSGLKDQAEQAQLGPIGQQLYSGANNAQRYVPYALHPLFQAAGINASGVDTEIAFARETGKKIKVTLPEQSI